MFENLEGYGNGTSSPTSTRISVPRLCCVSRFYLLSLTLRLRPFQIGKIETQETVPVVQVFHFLEGF